MSTSRSPGDSSNREHYSYADYARPEIARGFDQDRFGGAVGAYFQQVHERQLWELMPDPEGLKVLDVGAGTGRFSLPLRRRGAEVMAVDASLPMLVEAMRKAAALDIRLSCGQADAHALPFKDRSFDVVVSSRMLMHVLDWRAVLAELCRISRRVVIVDFPPRSSIAVLAPVLLPLKKRIKRSTQVYAVLSEREVGEEFARCGFFVAARSRQFLLPFFVHRMMKRPAWSDGVERCMRRLGLTGRLGAPLTLMAVRPTREER
ncbi:class I SAM-dependent methyltransferase [bacterium]|nr:class I SAM-dependent methyltransferase [candidate division CSSED10-310 bacterium]